MEIFPGADIAYCNRLIEDEGFDLVFTFWDIWKLEEKRRFPKDKWVAYVPIDSEWISTALKNVVTETAVQIAMSKHGLRELRSIDGLTPLYAPHGVDMAVMRPDDEGRKRFRDYFKFDDETFVIGSVGLNYGDDRKGFFPLIMAFQKFLERHPKSALYLHTDAGVKGTDVIPYATVAKSAGVGDHVYFPHQMSYYQSRIGEDWLRETYNGFDVFCLPTKGEGFGLPTVDAQACGVPVIVTNNTTGPELVKTGWLIDVTDDDKRWMLNDAWRLEPRASAVLARLEDAYSAWQDKREWAALRETARERILDYDWDKVWHKYWRPIWQLLEKAFGRQS